LQIKNTARYLHIDELVRHMAKVYDQTKLINFYRGNVFEKINLDKEEGR
jgi:hypothetical protein